MTAERVLFKLYQRCRLVLGIAAAAEQAVHGSVSCTPPATWAAAVCVTSRCTWLGVQVQASSTNLLLTYRPAQAARLSTVSGVRRRAL